MMQQDINPSAVHALELKQLHKGFGATEIICGIDLVVKPRERIGIIGPNGAGKSTLFNLISGRLQPSQGEVLLKGCRIDGLRPYQINRKGLSRSFQTTHVFPQLSVFENLRCSVLWSLGYRYAFWRLLDGLVDANQQTQQLMQQLQLDTKRNTLAMNLSYAEQRALELGVTLAGGADVVLLDEPTAGMSLAESAHFVKLIRSLTVGKTLLMIEHDMDVVFGLADKILVMTQGQVLAFDSPQAVRSNPQVQAAYLGSSVKSTCDQA